MTKEKLVTIHVHTPFKLTHADNSVQEFGKGRHNVPEAVASHWFVEAHTEALGDYTRQISTKPARNALLSWKARLPNCSGFWRLKRTR